MADTAVPRRRGLAALLVVGAMVMAADTLRDSFDAGMDGWEPVVAERWEVAEAEGNALLRLKTPGTLREGVRRPAEYVLARDAGWRDVTIRLRLRSLRPATVIGRDAVVIFGWRDDTHFYYAHVSNDSNGSTHNIIMKVAGETRQAIQQPARPEPRLSDGWHEVQVEHRADGTIQVFMDDLETPLMTAQESDYPSGRVGFGTFDDVAEFDDVVIDGTRL